MICLDGECMSITKHGTFHGEQVIHVNSGNNSDTEDQSQVNKSDDSEAHMWCI